MAVTSAIRFAIRVSVAVIVAILGVVLAAQLVAAGQAPWESPSVVLDEAAVERAPAVSPMSVALDDGDHHHGWWGGDWDWWIVMAPMMLLFWAGFIGLVFWLFRQGRGSGRNQGADEPLEIARARYARGEISREEFEQIRGDLGRG